MVEKGENAGHQPFLLFPQCFQKAYNKGLINVMIGWERFNSLPNDKILGSTKLEAFSGNKINVALKIISIFDRVENTEGKGKLLVTSIFCFSHNVFKRPLSQGF